MQDLSETVIMDHESLALFVDIIEVEDSLAKEITLLWGAHRDRMSSAKRTKVELQILRLALGEKLHAMKSLLVRTGRGGGWAAYLRSHRLPRASADRYVREHGIFLHPLTGKRLNEAFHATTESEVRELAQKLLPRLLRVLNTNDAVYYFLDELVSYLPAVGGSAGHDI